QIKPPSGYNNGLVNENNITSQKATIIPYTGPVPNTGTGTNTGTNPGTTPSTGTETQDGGVNVGIGDYFPDTTTPTPTPSVPTNNNNNNTGYQQAGTGTMEKVLLGGLV